MIKLSKTSKMPCKSWSLEALETCPGAFDSGEIVEVCQVCYARFGNYRFPNAKQPRKSNKESWKSPEFVPNMVAAIGKDPYFRWFDSGDAYSLGLWRKIHDICEQTPLTKHWIPTRMWKFSKFRPLITKVRSLPNVTVRISSDVFDQAVVEHGTSSFVSAKPSDSAFNCGAYSRNGKCGDCRACWDKAVPIVAYPGHGAVFARLTFQRKP